MNDQPRPPSSGQHGIPPSVGGRGRGGGRGGSRGRGTRASQPNRPSSRKGGVEEDLAPRQGGACEPASQDINGSYHCEYLK